MVKWACQDRYPGRARFPSISRAQIDDLRQRLWEFPERLDRGDHNTTELYALTPASTVQKRTVPFFNAIPRFPRPADGHVEGPLVRGLRVPGRRRTASRRPPTPRAGPRVRSQPGAVPASVRSTGTRTHPPPRGPSRTDRAGSEAPSPCLGSGQCPYDGRLRLDPRSGSRVCAAEAEGAKPTDR